MDRAELVAKCNSLVGHTITASEYVKYDYVLEADVVRLVLSDGRTLTINDPEIHGEGKAISAAPRKPVVSHAGLFLVKAELKDFVEDLQQEEASDARSEEQLEGD